MIRKTSILPVRAFVLSGLTLMAAGSAALLGGCKGNTTSAAIVEHRVGQPPIVIAQRATEDMRQADPLSSPAWQRAMMPLNAPANTPRTTAPTRGAVIYDDKTLHVAFICEKPTHTGGSAAECRDVVSLYIDPLSTGTELFQITVDSTGQARCVWSRCSEPAEPLEDGSPNLGLPVSVTLDVPVKGLWTKIGEGMDKGNAVWTAQLALPVAGLPTKLQVKPEVGTHWKFNLVRTFTTMNGKLPLDQAQANLSPFYVNAQAVSPYRLAELDFGVDKLAANDH